MVTINDIEADKLHRLCDVCVIDISVSKWLSLEVVGKADDCVVIGETVDDDAGIIIIGDRKKLGTQIKLKVTARSCPWNILDRLKMAFYLKPLTRLF